MKNPPRLTLIAIVCFVTLCGYITIPAAVAELPGTVLAFVDPTPAKPAPAGSRVPEVNSEEALKELQKARKLLSETTSISARLVQTVSMADRSVKGEGSYLQGSLKDGALQLKLELKMKVDGMEGSLLEVCDGEVLWTSHMIAKEPTITRRNVTQILEAARKRGGIDHNALVADLGLGGLPALLASIQRVMIFTAIKKDTLRDRPVFVLQGSWTADQLARWQGIPQPGVAPPPLPIFIPDVTRIYLDRETGFPLRLLYLKRVPGRDTLRPTLTLDFIDVVLNQPINKTEFTFKPPEKVTPIEITPAYLSQLIPPELPGAAATTTLPGATPSPGGSPLAP